jgi:hypothetical protein
MWLKIALALALTMAFGRGEAKADVVLMDVPQRVTLIPGKVTIEPFICPFVENDSRCPTQAKPRGRLRIG